MKRIFLLGLLIGLVFLVQAGGNLKTNTMKGKVTDRDGSPIIGAKVVLMNSDKEAYTDFEGNFTFKDVSVKEQKVNINYISYHEVTTSVIPTDKTLEIRLRSK